MTRASTAAEADHFSSCILREQDVLSRIANRSSPRLRLARARHPEQHAIRQHSGISLTPSFDINASDCCSVGNTSSTQTRRHDQRYPLSLGRKHWAGFPFPASVSFPFRTWRSAEGIIHYPPIVTTFCLQARRGCRVSND